eukprot:GFYU01004905.1.p1 GENE.GFYU01004905.1~~GFYU01004905.1.p1  ORF type:complete len:464 (+),score=104.38 GFYU01004905.1:113-1504(+)
MKPLMVGGASASVIRTETKGSARGSGGPRSVEHAWESDDTDKQKNIQKYESRRRHLDPDGNNSPLDYVFHACAMFTENRYFYSFMVFVIIAAGILVGLQTFPDIERSNKEVFHVVDWIITGIFTLEVVLKILALGYKPLQFFKDPWNVFDFFVVVLSYLPIGSYVLMLRMVRILRVLKLLRAIPELQVLTRGLLKGMSSMFYILMFLFLIFYIYAVIAVTSFQKNDPYHFKHLGIAFFTLFRICTLEDWTDIVYINMYGCDEYGYTGESYEDQCTEPKAFGWPVGVFFSSFVVISTMIVMNLFIGVITNSMQEARDELRRDDTQDEAEEEEDPEVELVRQFDHLLVRSTEELLDLRTQILNLDEDVEKLVRMYPEVVQLSQKLAIDAKTPKASTSLFGSQLWPSAPADQKDQVPGVPLPPHTHGVESSANGNGTAPTPSQPVQDDDLTEGDELETTYVEDDQR